MRKTKPGLKTANSNLFKMRKPFNLAIGVPFRVQLIYAEDLLAINSDHQSVAPSQDPLQAKGPLAQLQGQHSRLVKCTLLLITVVFKLTSHIVSHPKK